MTLGSLIYRILIGPLELFFEVVFVIADRHVSNPAYAIILLSLAMNFLVLPLYRRADAVQAAERDREQALSPWIKHIKKTFKGDERFMMLQTFYRQNNYKPTDSLKGSISLLLEIPFFIAAYHFLSNLEELRGISFGPIADLGSPDALISIGSASINLLPILMTLINVISAAIYMKGFPLKSKIQMYGIAAIFLVFLYNSPAGLVFYWTLNNLFSLIKNIFYKLKNPAGVLRVISSVTGVLLLLFFILLHPMPSMRSQLIVITALLVLQIPLLKFLFNRTGKNLTIHLTIKSDYLFYVSAALLTILTGILIPSAVISSSTEEFIDIANYQSPFWYIVGTLAIAAGTFLIWFNIFYRLTSETGKPVFAIGMAALSSISIADYMFFGKSYGNFSSMLVYDETPEINLNAILTNLLIIIIITLIIAILASKKVELMSTIMTMACIALIIMSGLNVMNISRVINESRDLITAAVESEPEIELSKSGKNVVVIMMDRQIGHFIPFIMHERPSLYKSFDGFTYYSNSFSYGTVTNIGSPGLYGGYDYTPTEMNKRKDEKLVDKHNESLKVLPRIFSEKGYDVNVISPSYAGYEWIPDISIYNDLNGVKGSIAYGRFSLPEYGYETDSTSKKSGRMHNFFCYSIFKIAPTVFQPTIYQKGSYNSAATQEVSLQQVINNMHSAEGYRGEFMDAYATLCNLQNITTITENEHGSFLMMSNDTAHEPMLLQEPSYVPSPVVDNSSFIDNDIHKEDDNGNELILENDYQLSHYHVNMAAMIKLGEWFDYLKEHDLYDNTRIIIVSDHGRGLWDNVMPYINYTDQAGELKDMDSNWFNCVLLVKDFDSHSFHTDDKLISNADTPALALNNIVDKPINPYTNNPIRRIEDISGDYELFYSFDWKTDVNDGNVFLPADWFTISGDIKNKNSWKHIGYH